MYLACYLQALAGGISPGTDDGQTPDPVATQIVSTVRSAVRAWEVLDFLAVLQRQIRYPYDRIWHGRPVTAVCHDDRACRLEEPAFRVSVMDGSSEAINRMGMTQPGQAFSTAGLKT